MVDHIFASLRRFLPTAAAVGVLALATVVTATWLLAPAKTTNAQAGSADGIVQIGTCADPIAQTVGSTGSSPGVVTATDALLVLQAAVALVSCDLCVCDVNGSGAVTAADALGTLAIATGQNIPLACPPCFVSTTSTTCPEQSPPENGLNFGVTDGSVGVPGSGVAAEAAVDEHPADLFTSGGTGEHSPAAAGDNTLAVEDAGLGLATDDELDAVSFGAYVASPYAYYFSLKDSPRIAGIEGSGVRDEYDNEVVPGDIYRSTGVPAPTRGDNTLSTDEIALGLQPHDLSSDPTDDLDALDFGTPNGPYYLSVAGSGNSGGADIFRSSGGTATQILSAADIGLLDSDEVDALVVQDVDDDGTFSSGDYLLFSVSLASAGEPGSDVRAQARLGEAAGDIFVSTGDGSHTLLLDESSLGLRPADDIDALEIRNEEVVVCGCGDGVLVAPEQCEVGIPCANPAAVCNPADCTCAEPFCQDGILQSPPEQCEFPGPPCPPGQWCTPTCKCVNFKTCKDGVLDPGEACETGIPCPNLGDICTPNCQCEPLTEGYCGNGILDSPGEQCDPPGADCPQGQTCNRATCECLPDTAFQCPNGVLEGTEECERGIPCPSDDEACVEAECDCVEIMCTPNGELDPGEACDPFADPNGCLPGLSCNEECECRLFTQRCGDGALTPGAEECEAVSIGGMTTVVGCASDEKCNLGNCMCEPCIDPDPKDVEVIMYQGFAIPTCQLFLAGPDACPEDHWHGSGFGIDATGTDISFFTDPNQPECGFGGISDRPPTTYSLSGAIACQLLALNVPCVAN